MKSLLFGLASIAGTAPSLAETKSLEYTEICARMEMKIEVFSFDKNGSIIDKKREAIKLSNRTPWTSIGTEQCILKSNWASQWDKNAPVLAISSEYEVNEDHSLSLTVSQYKTRGESRSPEEKAILTKTFDVTSMEGVQWVSPLHKDNKVVVRFTPNLSFRTAPEDLDKVAISARSAIIHDKNESIWTKDMNINGKYVALKTHLGGVAMSFYKFPGATEIGEANGNVIRLMNGENDLTFTSTNNFLPSGQVAKVYGFFSAKKTQGPHSESAWTNNEVERFLENIEGNL